LGFVGLVNESRLADNGIQYSDIFWDNIFVIDWIKSSDFDPFGGVGGREKFRQK